MKLPWERVQGLKGTYSNFIFILRLSIPESCVWMTAGIVFGSGFTLKYILRRPDGSIAGSYRPRTPVDYPQLQEQDTAMENLLVVVSLDTQYSPFGRDDFHKGKNPIPETRTGEEGSSKRNIQRKHDHDPHRKPKPNHGGGVGGKGQWNDIDDGSMP